MWYTLLLFVFLLWALFVTAIVISSFIGFLRTRTPFVRTTTKDIQAIVRRAKISSTDVFYDLGSGDGWVVFEVERLTGARGKGFELMWWTHLWARLKKFLKRSQSEFYRKDFFKEDWSEATVVYTYLYPPFMGRVEEKFLSDCKPGTVAILRDFPFPNLKPLDTFVTSPELLGQRAGDGKRIPSAWEKFGYMLKGIARAYRTNPHDIYIYRR